ncbi:FkbM family methyltransferase [Pelagicoccus albus]|uniref:FkbM family methyltransferase n=1 Tax=Pelagicoccus albus TaxID=415222 RepID=A0A7X1B9P3_9BACT|nr:FkbM family methyltransferase [Pelagicoccus albus]MBC2606930.1 FkbM family methyltransferase [Pelagicoccus albus]
MPYFTGIWEHLESNQTALSEFSRTFGNFTLHDLGAAGGCPPPYCYATNCIKLVNFEPVPNASVSAFGTSIETAIGPSELNRLYINKRPTTSSLLRPCKRVTDRYTFLPIFGKDDDIFETVEEIPIQTTPLDEAISRFNIPPPQSLKIDVQGLTYEVLEGASKTLEDHTICIGAEVEFIESYTDQKSFGAVHELLRSQDFELFKQDNLNKWYYRKNLPGKIQNGQHAFCDFLYFRSIDTIGVSKFWNETNARLCLGLLLLHDLVDSADAYYKRFTDNSILHPSSEIEAIISEWRSALSFFYHDPFEKLVDQSGKQYSLTELSGKKIGIYGAGSYGTWIEQRLKEATIQPICFIDQNHQKLVESKSLFVVSPEDRPLMSSLDTIVICSIGSVEPIRAHIDQLNLPNKPTVLSVFQQ